MPEKKPPRYFHGTSADLEPGSVLVPGAQRNNFATWRDRDNSAVFMTRTASGATRWAGNAAKNHGKDTAHVYEVEPLGPVEKRRTPWEGDEHLTPQARVVRRVSSHRVLNPGQEDGPFGDVPAKIEPIRAAARSKGPEQVKGQRALFPTSAVGPASAATSRTAAAALGREESARTWPEPPVIERSARRADVDGQWAAYDHDVAAHKEYLGLPKPSPRRR